MRKHLAISLAITYAFASALVSAGCSNNSHPVVGAGKTCESCHNLQQDTAVKPADLHATDVMSNLTVETAHEKVSLCTPIFMASGKFDYIPSEYQAFQVKDGKAQLEIPDGIWVIAAYDSFDSSVSKLVHVSDAGEDSLIL